MNIEIKADLPALTVGFIACRSRKVNDETRIRMKKAISCFPMNTTFITAGFSGIYAEFQGICRQLKYHVKEHYVEIPETANADEKIKCFYERNSQLVNQVNMLIIYPDLKNRGAVRFSAGQARAQGKRIIEI